MRLFVSGNVDENTLKKLLNESFGECPDWIQWTTYSYQKPEMEPGVTFINHDGGTGVYFAIAHRIPRQLSYGPEVDLVAGIVDRGGFPGRIRMTLWGRYGGKPACSVTPSSNVMTILKNDPTMIYVGEIPMEDLGVAVRGLVSALQGLKRDPLTSIEFSALKYRFMTDLRHGRDNPYKQAHEMSLASRFGRRYNEDPGAYIDSYVPRAQALQLPEAR